LDLARIVADLKKERDRINRAIAVLESLSSPKPDVRQSMPAPGKIAPTTQKRGGLTPEGRKRLSDLMKKRWAERRKKKR
jgi:hypothetical protein